jgi:hypothetical protein
MRDRQSIIGFTEAELGFFVAVLLLAVFLERRSTAPSAERPRKDAAVELQQARIQIGHLEQRLADLPATQSDLGRERQSAKTETQAIKGLRSRQKPSCRERGVAKGFLLNVTVEGSNSFKVGDTVMNLAGLLGSVEPRLAVARQADCVESVRIFYDYRRVSLGQAVIARHSLQEHFYVAEP